MNIEIPAQATLRHLDQFLRDIWLECCGHLSVFNIEGQRYDVHPIEDLGSKTMAYPLEKVLSPGMVFEHEYDFGTTTDLTLKVVSERMGSTVSKKRRGDDIQILARNNPPQILCVECNKKPATIVCAYCRYDTGGWLCKSCAKKHECSDEALLPVVNSPRVGECGYTGPEYPAYL